MDSMIAPINVHSIGKTLFTKHDSRNTQVSLIKKSFLGFPCFSTCEDLSIDVSITNVGLILTKLG